jgi:hypothetical protein
MALLYEVDFRTLPNQVIGAAGAYEIDGLEWWAKGPLLSAGTTFATNIVNGSGWHWDVISGSGITSIGTGGILPHRHYFLPLSNVPLWEPTMSYMVRARYSFTGSPVNQKPFIGVTSTTSDSVEIQAAARAAEILIAPTPSSGSVSTLDIKLGGAAPTTGNARSVAIANGECVVGVYHFTPRFAYLGSEHLVSGMPTDISTWLAMQSIAVQDYNALRTNPGVLFTVTSGDHNFYLQQLRIDSVGDLLDSTAPTVTLISPPLGRIQRHSTIVLRVADADEIKRVNLWVEYENGIWETVYARGVFSPVFDGRSDVETIIAGQELEFTLQRAGGWPAGGMNFEAEPIDRGGNVSS